MDKDRARVALAKEVLVRAALPKRAALLKFIDE